MTLTSKARELIARVSQRPPAKSWQRTSASGTAYPEFKVVYCPRKSGVVWMARYRRRNISEHPTRDEAIAALNAIKAQQAKN
jgi:hypothetical protein